jgi:integrase
LASWSSKCDARHIFATLLIESGLSDFEVARQMGHGSIDRTTRVSGHLRPEWLADVQRRLDKAVVGSVT